jgi:hypothetical protein
MLPITVAGAVPEALVDIFVPLVAIVTVLLVPVGVPALVAEVVPGDPVNVGCETEPVGVDGVPVNEGCETEPVSVLCVPAKAGCVTDPVNVDAEPLKDGCVTEPVGVYEFDPPVVSASPAMLVVAMMFRPE